MSDSIPEMKVRAVRAYVGVALRNLSLLRASDKDITGITYEVQRAECLLIEAEGKLDALLAKARGETSLAQAEAPNASE